MVNLINISIGQQITTKDESLVVKQILFNPIANSNPNYYIELDKVEVNDQLNDYITIVTHKNTKIKLIHIKNYAV